MGVKRCLVKLRFQPLPTANIPVVYSVQMFLFLPRSRSWVRISHLHRVGRLTPYSLSPSEVQWCRGATLIMGHSGTRLKVSYAALIPSWILSVSACILSSSALSIAWFLAWCKTNKSVKIEIEVKCPDCSPFSDGSVETFPHSDWQHLIPTTAAGNDDDRQLRCEEKNILGAFYGQPDGGRLSHLTRPLGLLCLYLSAAKSPLLCLNECYQIKKPYPWMLNAFIQFHREGGNI